MPGGVSSRVFFKFKFKSCGGEVRNYTKTFNMAFSCHISEDSAAISFKSKLELLLASKQASMFASLKLRFDLSWGGEIVNTDFPVVFYRATAALYHWPSNTIVLYSRLFLLALVLIPIQSLVP